LARSACRSYDDLRHTHKTWLIEDGVPEVAKAKRLGLRGSRSRLAPLAWEIGCGCRIGHPRHATWEYSWINPPSRS
jgi:hypothetical protein